MSDFDLETLVRAVRPEPAPQWAGRLDRRVADGFPRAPRWWHWEQLRMQLAWAGAAVSTVGVLVLIVWGISSVSVGGSDDKASSSSGSYSASSASTPMSETKSAAGSASSSAPVAPDARVQIRNVELTLSTAPASVEDVSDKAIAVADDLGGYVADSSVTARQSAELTLKVPQAKLQQALTQLSRLGHVTSRTQDTQDVTDQKAQLDSAVRDARAYRDSLRSRLARAKTDRLATSLRGRLARAEQALRERERDVARLAGQTSMATIAVTIHGDRHPAGAVVASGGRWTPGDALRDAGRVLEVIAGVLVIALAVLVPVAILAALAVALNRLLTRRRRERALELA
jgi:hypothetical protein